MSTGDMGEFTNQGMRVKVGGIELHLTPLSVGDLFGWMAATVKQQAIRSAQEMAAAIADPHERTRFLVAAWERLPSGRELWDRMPQVMASPDGLAGLVRASAVKGGQNTAKAIDAALAAMDVAEIPPILDWLTGGAVTKEQAKQEDGAEANPPQATVPTS